MLLLTTLPSLLLHLLIRTGGGGGTVTAETPRSQSCQNEGRVSFLGFCHPQGGTSRRAGGQFLWTVRGGSEEEEEDDEEDNEEENDSAADNADEEEEEIEVKVDNDDDDSEAVPVDLSKVLESAAEYTHSTVLPVTQKALAVLFKLGTKATMATVHALQRAVEAAMEGDERDEDHPEEDDVAAEVSVVQRVVLVVKRMVTAAFTFPDGDEQGGIIGGIEEAALKTKKTTKGKQAKATSKALDFGSYLAASYGVQDPRTDTTPGTAVMGGSFATAMNEARAQARLLVVFLPVEKYKKGKESREATAMESILSPEVAEASNQPARKGEETGSFLFWSAKLGSSEATQAMKRLKAKIKTSKGSKCPILMVVYPAMVSEPHNNKNRYRPWNAKNKMVCPNVFISSPN